MTTRNLSLTALCVSGLFGWPLSSGCSGDEGASSQQSDTGGSAGEAGSGGGSGSAGSSGVGGSFGIDPDAGAFGGSDSGVCGGDLVEAQPRQVHLIVVLDRSESMLKSWGEPTRWSVMRDALGAALDTVKDQMSIGLQLFPVDSHCGTSSETELTVGVAAGTSTVPMIEAALGAAEPGGATPTADALERALAYFSTGAGKDLEGDKYVLLATDGGPNCNQTPEMSCAETTCTTNMDQDCPAGVPNCCVGAASDACLDDQRSIGRVEALQTAGISTFVVGIPGTAAYGAVLDALAVAGGTAVGQSSPRYFEVADASALAATLSGITRTLVRTCHFALTSVPPDRSKVNVFIDGEVLPKLGDDGWDFDNATNPPTIVIKGQTCSEVESRGAESVQIEFGCPTVEIY